MKKIKSVFIGLITFILILVELIIGFGTLAIINIPRAFIPIKSFKVFISRVSNYIGDLTVYGLKLIMLLMHGDSIIIIEEHEELDQDDWYMAMSNHQSWADIFVLLVAANYKLPLLKFFMKKELWWIPFVLLANKTTTMLHGEQAAKNSEQAAKEAFSGNSLGSNLPTVYVKLKSIDETINIEESLNRISANVTIEDLCGNVEYIQESAPEILSVKQELFAKLDNLAPDEVVIGSSSSAMPISSITQNLKGQHRCIIAHPANPPHLIPCVEICPGENTSNKTIEKTKEIFTASGASIVNVKKEIDGFILNRLQGAP